MKSRSNGSTRSNSTQNESIERSDAPLPRDSNPPRVYILPERSPVDARIITLSNPATTKPTRYYICPEKGVFEFTKMVAPTREPRSWLLAAECERAPQILEEPENDRIAQADNGMSHGPSQPARSSIPSGDNWRGYVLETPELFVTTPVDPLFLILPYLGMNANQKGSELFLAADDYLDRICEASPHFTVLLHHEKMRRRFERRIAAVCDTVQAGEENMYRLSLMKLAGELFSKSRRILTQGLPTSLEERFVQDALEIPLSTTVIKEGVDASEKRSDYERSDTVGDEVQQSPVMSKETLEKKRVCESLESIRDLLRLRTALEFIIYSYVPRDIRQHLQEIVKTNELVNFEPLDKYLDQIASLKREARALQAMSDNISRKRISADDEEAVEVRAQKKRKKEEDEKKKLASRGVKELRKVDTSGMKKLSSFFSKAGTKKEARA
jgi:hypothetical protein